MDIAWWLADARALLVRRLRWLASPGFRSVPSRWLQRPAIAAGDEVCLFVTLVRAGEVPPHALFHARAWAAQGFRVVMILVADDLDATVGLAPLAFAAGIMVRHNWGYDFGAWAAAIDALPGLRSVARVAIANDSVLGPTRDFPAMLARVRAADADIVGLTESAVPGRHLQSYVLVFGPRALASRAFRRFWRGVRTGTRDLVVNLCELRLTAAMARGGLRWQALFPYDPLDAPNPTLIGWRKLLAAGLPYLKIQLLRDNPFGVPIEGWERVLTEAGFDPSASASIVRGKDA